MSSTFSRPTTATSSRPPSRPGTAGRTTSSTSDLGDWIVAVLEGRGKGREVGVVAIARDLGRVLVTQYSDTSSFVKTLHLLTTRPPSLILVPATSLPSTALASLPSGTHGDDTSTGFGGKGEATLLVRSLQDAWKGVSLVPIARKYWNSQDGIEYINELIVHDETRSSTITSATSKFYALSSAAALFKYLETQAIAFSPCSLRIEYVALEGTCLIDSDTATNLELVANVLNKNSKQHLLGLLNRCFTPMGTRLLRTSILAPLADVVLIDLRLDSVEEMIGSEAVFHAVRKSLEPLKKIDIDTLVGQIISSRPQSLTSKSDPAKDSELKITRVLLLRTILNALPAIRLSLQNTDSLLLRTVYEVLGDHRADEMLDAIGKTINDDAIECLQKGTLAVRSTKIYAIRSERKLLLDVARETFRENINDATQLAEEMKETYGMEVAMVYSAAGCHFTCAASEVEARPMPKVFTNVRKKGKKFEFTSMDLKKKNARIAESVQEIFIMSDEILNELLEDIRQSISFLYRASEAVALLDMLSSFADVASNNNYVRPEWTDTLAIKSGRHPLHEHFRLSDGSFVPNDTYASDSASFQLVGGSNMSGKSTLLRQIATMYIMAQIGCYVPATYASFRVIDALLSRLSNDDSIESSLSTFSKEMSTMAMILSTLQTSRRTLVIIDELGRGTSPTEGVGIAHAIAESIIQHKTICFFATHFKDLGTTLGRYPNVVSLHLETEIDKSQKDYNLVFNHRVLDGQSPLTHYGINLAKLVKLPADVMEKATLVSAQLESLAEQGRRGAKSTKLAIRRRALLRLKTSLRELYQSKTMDVPDLVAELKKLQLDALKMLSATIATAVVPHSSPSSSPSSIPRSLSPQSDAGSSSPSSSPTASRISSIPAPSRKVVEIQMEQLVLTHSERTDDMDETLAFDDD